MKNHPGLWNPGLFLGTCWFHSPVLKEWQAHLIGLKSGNPVYIFGDPEHSLGQRAALKADMWTRKAEDFSGDEDGVLVSTGLVSPRFYLMGRLLNPAQRQLLKSCIFD